MGDPDPFKAWLDDFHKQVETAMAHASVPQSPAAQSAREAFDNWWQAEHDPVTESSRGSSTTVLGPESPTEIERLSEDKARLEQEIERLSRENAGLRQKQSGLESELGEFQAELSRSRESHDSDVGRLQAEIRGLKEQVKTLNENKAFLEEAFLKVGEERKRLDQELRLEREKTGLAEKSLLELRQKAADREAVLGKLREENAAKLGALEELRRQASVYQERLVQAKELTDADIALMRQELKTFLEEMKILRNTMKKEKS